MNKITKNIAGITVGCSLMWLGNYLRYGSSTIYGVSMCYPMTGITIGFCGCYTAIVCTFDLIHSFN